MTSEAIYTMFSVYTHNSQLSFTGENKYMYNKNSATCTVSKISKEYYLPAHTKENELKITPRKVGAQGKMGRRGDVKLNHLKTLPFRRSMRFSYFQSHSWIFNTRFSRLFPYYYSPFHRSLLACSVLVPSSS